MRAASGLIVATGKVEILPCGAGGEEYWVKFVLGDAVAAWEREREERESNLDFQIVNLVGSIAHFRFVTRMAMVRVQVAA